MSTIQDQMNLLRTAVPPELSQLLDRRDGAAQIVPKLRADIDPLEQAQGQIWDNCAIYYSLQGRHFEALSIYYAMYERFMELQEADGMRRHKGLPLVRISDAHASLGHPLTAKRYMMLTICEDAISLAGNIPAETSGSYFRAVWQYGISHDQLNDYAAKIWGISLKQEKESRFPEWVLQELDQKWLVDYPSTSEASLYIANTAYVRWLLAQLGKGDGLALERLAHYLLSCVPGFRVRMRMRTLSTDYDVIGAVEGPMFDFRSELGSYFLCECKDWNKPANVSAVQKFAQVLESAKCRFGIIFSKKGISGQDNTRHADRELLKIQQKMTILVLSEFELGQIASGLNFFSLLRDTYEQTRLDLPKTIKKKTSGTKRKVKR